MTVEITNGSPTSFPAERPLRDESAANSEDTAPHERPSVPSLTGDHDAEDAYTEDEEAEVTARLRDLGYL